MTEPVKGQSKIAFWILVTVSVFYGYGALVHVLNMLGLSGFDWSTAPLKWQVLDVVYLVLDMTVCFGLVKRLPVSLLAFYAAGLTQLVLYTALRSWILDVPEPFTITADQDNYLTLLVVFHAVTLALVTYALRVTSTGSQGTRHPANEQSA